MWQPNSTYHFDSNTPHFDIPTEQSDFMHMDYSTSNSNSLDMALQQNNINNTVNSFNQLEDRNYQWISCYPVVNDNHLNFVENWSKDETLLENDVNKRIGKLSLDYTFIQDNNYAPPSMIQSDNNTKETHESINDCKICVTNSRDRNPFDKIILCKDCQHQWKYLLLNYNINKEISNKSVTKMLHDQQMRLTRNMAHKLTDNYGFGPNIHGYSRHRPVMVTFFQEKSKKEYIGLLCELKQGKVKVWVPEIQVFEWFPVGSRRLKIMAPHEESSANAVSSNTDNSIQDEKVMLCMQTQKADSKPAISQQRLHQLPSRRPNKIRKKHPNRNIKTNNSHSTATDNSFLTTGAFATRKAIHRLRYNSGFIPNPYGYIKNQAVQILDTRGSKTNSWCRGTLVEMRPGYVKVHYNERSDAHDKWFIIGSRRIRIDSNDNNDLKSNVNPDAQHEENKKRRSLKTNSQQNCINNLEIQQQQNCSNSTKQSIEKPIISLRVAQYKALETEQFLHNIYGYYYMQHVIVLYSDKKYYEARLICIQKNKVKVHYCGWIDIFDEFIPLGSKRIQSIESDNQHVECLEPNYHERYKQMQIIDSISKPQVNTPECYQRDNKAILDKINQIKIKSDTKEDVIAVVGDIVATNTPKIYCNQCKINIKQFRYYCSYCENSSCSNLDSQGPFQLCIDCFDHFFPNSHQHPRSGFAIQAVVIDKLNQKNHVNDNTRTVLWEEDILQEQSNNLIEEEEDASLDASKVFTGINDFSTRDKLGYLFLQKWQDRKICAFCNDDDASSQELGPFIGPFVNNSIKRLGQEKKRTFWAHDACARYSPEVIYSADEGKWYNIARALRRGRSMRCHVCKEKGATIGCFDSKCSKSFHLPCTKKPTSNFKNGVIFWCIVHEAFHNKKDDYINVFHCDGCSKKLLKDELWFTCEQCSLANYFSSFDLCSECYNNNDLVNEHNHDKSNYKETSYARIEEIETQNQSKKDYANNRNNTTNKKVQLFPRCSYKLANGSTPTSCCYCGTFEAETWRKGYDGGIIMCNACFEMVYSNNNIEQPPHQNIAGFVAENYVASIEDYSHKPYFTRDVLSFTKSSTGTRLKSYEPQPNQLFSLAFESTYFDIPGRAPRWATHSGTDYHGTWLPQTVRRALLKYTKKDERILSNFLGRGTDAIECFLLQRKCCGIDINPAAVALSQRNCCFEIPAGLTFAKYRPIIALADARQLNGSLFQDNSYHHILSHPPYKDCVAYSTHLDGDLSRFTHIDDFKLEYTRVIQESYRLLKMDRRLTLGIGDNREHCFYIAVGFHLIRLYIDQGFELEELVIKRQRYCSAFGLGTYLCVQFDFLVFTHEFIATFKKIPHDQVDKMSLIFDNNDPDTVNSYYTSTLYGIPPSAITRKSRAMGTVWIFNLSNQYSFAQLCISRMIERFGQDECNWLHIKLLVDITIQEQYQKHESGSFSLPFTSTSEAVETISEYEQKRLRKIQENNETLLKLGLISDLGQESVVNDSIHCDTMLNKKPYIHADLVVIATGHIENLDPNQINHYRKSIIQLAQDAIPQLAVKGMLIIGTKDIRDKSTGKLWPISMLVFEDIERTTSRLKLKEMVFTVPEGYSKSRDITVAIQQQQQQQEEEHLPIVHAIYLIFQKQ